MRGGRKEKKKFEKVVAESTVETRFLSEVWPWSDSLRLGAREVSEL